MALGPTADEVLAVKRRIVKTAAAMEGGEIELFDGCRRLADLRLRLDDETMGTSEMIVFMAIDSELDAYPFGSSRAHWAPEVLAEKDAQRADYLERVRDTILSACRAVRLKWSDTGSP